MSGPPRSHQNLPMHPACCIHQINKFLFVERFTTHVTFSLYSSYFTICSLFATLIIIHHINPVYHRSSRFITRTLFGALIWSQPSSSSHAAPSAERTIRSLAGAALLVVLSTIRFTSCWPVTKQCATAIHSRHRCLCLSRLITRDTKGLVRIVKSYELYRFRFYFPFPSRGAESSNLILFSLLSHCLYLSFLLQFICLSICQFI